MPDAKLVRLYHGSNIDVPEPRILAPRRALDFGPGFYTTSSREQAARWAQVQQRRRTSGAATLTAYDLNYAEAAQTLSIRTFDAPDSDWLDFVVAHRKETWQGEHFDLIIGPVADDNTMTVIEDYVDGRYSKTEAVQRLLPHKLANQYAFVTNAALKLLVLVEIIRP
ncbi:hypothetical protein AGMMS50225_04700 [Betaproteobacteria bacterium]|nr:hypothetical protein AGMMS50225_04700 [Betaproteobacteria bacterium]